MQDDDLQQELAAVAARLIVDDAQDWASARRKAAAQLGLRLGRDVPAPSDEQLEDAVREHLAIFHADTQPGELRALRELALAWMERLAPFRPHLGGAVWRGTATAQSNILLDLYADDPKAVEIFFIDEHLDFDSQGEDAEHLVLSVSVRSRALGEWVTLHCSVHDFDALRGALQPDARGRSWRGPAEALRQLLQAEDNAR
ncbi:hypothetical protein [Ideonella livida]|uniref:Nucleotidyltransferase domain-containing protein n=1 Tax=Ideonella livida TaxID=2707176 RepID=A0A7C9TLM7_9BURK|nr:hypothetical protein [Ideonella livida]NDY93278.1 hypothetical protein [Ideonella livida]